MAPSVSAGSRRQEVTVTGRPTDRLNGDHHFFYKREGEKRPPTEAPAGQGCAIRPSGSQTTLHAPGLEYLLPKPTDRRFSNFRSSVYVYTLDREHLVF